MPEEFDLDEVMSQLNIEDPDAESEDSEDFSLDDAEEDAPLPAKKKKRSKKKAAKKKAAKKPAPAEDEDGGDDQSLLDFDGDDTEENEEDEVPAPVKKKKRAKKKASKKKRGRKPAGGGSSALETLQNELTSILQDHDTRSEVARVQARLRLAKTLSTKLTRFADKATKIAEAQASYIGSLESRLSTLKGEDDE